MSIARVKSGSAPSMSPRASNTRPSVASDDALFSSWARGIFSRSASTSKYSPRARRSSALGLPSHGIARTSEADMTSTRGSGETQDSVSAPTAAATHAATVARRSTR